MPDYSQLIEHLLVNQLAGREQIKEIRAQIQKKKGSFVEQLLSDNVISSQQLSEINRQVYNLPIANLRELAIDRSLTSKFNEETVRKHHALPIYAHGSDLYIATCDPANRNMYDEFRYKGEGNFTNVEAVIADYEAIELLIETHYAGQTYQSDFFEGEENSDILHRAINKIFTNQNDAEVPVVKFVTGMLLDAIRTNVSDIHFEPYEDSYRVRFRRDGILQEVAAPPRNITNRIAARLKVMASLNIAEKRLPQDGRIKLQLSETKAIDFRVSTLPTLWGEKIGLRILDVSVAQLNIKNLGFDEFQKENYLSALKKPQGLILVTGPTGSGKTFSLYSGLNLLNQQAVNICTVEDPVEINLPGVNQVNINEKIGLDFATVLRAFLRQDPDIIMVGEIRDKETAEIAVKAAQTGHLVLSTLHTNSVSQAMARLENIGVEPYNIASSVNLIMAQRLIRILCEDCKVRDRSYRSEELVGMGFEEDELDDLKLYAANGCDRCSQQGYRGRVAVYQVVPISENIRELITSKASAMGIGRAFSKEGFINLRQSALKKVRKGQTSISEVLRVIN